MDTSDSIAFDVTIQSVGRLHFGLLEIASDQPYRFGGIGLMVEHVQAKVVGTLGWSPQCEIIWDAQANPHGNAFQPYWLERIQSILERWRLEQSEMPLTSLRVERAPQPHRGLGSGTQMACTTISLLHAARHTLGISSRFSSETDLVLVDLFENTRHGATVESSSAVAKLAAESQRGKRSHIGLCGFLKGGFIVDRGEALSVAESKATQRTDRIDFPEAWPLMLMAHANAQGDSGSQETQMFEKSSSVPNPNRDAMLQLINEECVPALKARDWETFGKSLGQYGKWAGQVFQLAQGGIYRSPQMGETIHFLHGLGVYGATQSSWGPTFCAVAQDDEHAQWCIEQLRHREPDLQIEVVRACNRPAQCTLTPRSST